MNTASIADSVGGYEPWPRFHFLGFAVNIANWRCSFSADTVVAKRPSPISHQEYGDFFLQNDAHFGGLLLVFDRPSEIAAGAPSLPRPQREQPNHKYHNGQRQWPAPSPPHHQ
jgi:hypothetical protein